MCETMCESISSEDDNFFRFLYNSGVSLKKCSDTQILRESVATAGSVVCLFTAAAAAAEGCGGYSF